MLDLPLSRNEARIEESRLATLYRYEILDTPGEPAFDELVSLAAQICETPMSVISLIDSDRTWVKAKVGCPASEIPRYVSFCHYAISGHELFEVPDALEDSRFKENPYVVEYPKFRFYAGAPLITGDGHRLGTLCVIDLVPRKLTDLQRTALEVLSRRVIAQMDLRLINRRIRKWADTLLLDTEMQSDRAQQIGGATRNLDNIRALVMENLDLLSIACDEPPQRHIVERAISAGRRGGNPGRQLLTNDRERDDGEHESFGAAFNHLTPREKQILRLVARGLSNRETARRMGLAEATVKVYVQRIFKKVGVNNRTALAVLVARKRRSSGKIPAEKSAKTSEN
jgi:RNA polymerase sigma factor (sigma-70 family)